MRRPVLAVALLIVLSACQVASFKPKIAEAPAPAPVPTFNFEPVPGRWQVGKAANLRAGPSTDFPIVGGVRAGEPLDVLGKVPGAEWFAVNMGERHAYIHTRLVHQMDEPPPVTQKSIVAMPAPVMQAPPRAVQTVPATPPAPVAATPVPAPVPATIPVSSPVKNSRVSAEPPAAGGWVATGEPIPIRPNAR